jgi:hypothetical protein
MICSDIFLTTETHGSTLFQIRRESPLGFGLRQPSAAFASGGMIGGKAPEGWRTPGRWRDSVSAEKNFTSVFIRGFILVKFER